MTMGYMLSSRVKGKPSRSVSDGRGTLVTATSTLIGSIDYGDRNINYYEVRGSRVFSRRGLSDQSIKKLLQLNECDRY